MSQSVGTWVAGDSGKTFQYFATQDGVPLDVTGATTIRLQLIRLASGVEQIVTITGAIVSPGTLGAFEWVGANAIGVNVSSPPSRQEVHVYEARVTFVLAGLTYFTDPFRIAVTKWGASTVATSSPEPDPLYSFDSFEHDTPAGPQGATSLPGNRSAGFNDRPWSGVRAVNLPTGSNRIFEICKKYLINPGASPAPFHWLGGPMFSQPFTYRMIINPGNVFETPAGEALVGIEWGSFGVGPPFQDNYVGGQNGPVFQFRWNYTREKFELMVWDADTGTPPIVIDCDLQPTFTPDLYIKEFKMEYLPAAGGLSVLNCYLNGELAISYSGDRLQNCYGADSNYGAGFFTCGGTSGNLTLSDSTFYANIIHMPNFYRFPVPANQ